MIEIAYNKDDIIREEINIGIKKDNEKDNYEYRDESYHMPYTN